MFLGDLFWVAPVELLEQPHRRLRFIRVAAILPSPSGIGTHHIADRLRHALISGCDFPLVLAKNAVASLFVVSESALCIQPCPATAGSAFSRGAFRCGARVAMRSRASGFAHSSGERMASLFRREARGA